MTKYVMICRGFPDGRPCPYADQYLEWYDPEGPKSKPLAAFTPDLAKAKRFDNMLEAMTEWKLVRKRDGGVRPDGKPDRPLTAFTVEVIATDD